MSKVDEETFVTHYNESSVTQGKVKSQDVSVSVCGMCLYVILGYESGGIRYIFFFFMKGNERDRYKDDDEGERKWETRRLTKDRRSEEFLH